MENSSQGKQEIQKSNGEKFKNVCLGIAAIGAMVLPYLQYFLPIIFK